MTQLLTEEKRIRRNAYMREYYHKHPEKFGSPESRRASVKRYYIKHKDKVKARHERWMISTGLSIRREYDRRRYKTHKIQILAKGKKYRARKRGGGILSHLASLFYQRIRSLPVVPCYYCKQPIRGSEAHIDHVVALSNNGNHSIENLCAACPSCNLKKGIRNPSQLAFLAQLLLNL